MRALITRPRDDAGPIAAALAQRGIEAVIEPMLEIVLATEETPELKGVQALLFTSANAARAFAAATAERSLPAFTVGKTSAAIASGLGFTQVESADGDAEALARLVIGHLKPEGGALFHASGSAVAGEIGERLNSAGFTVRRQVLYEARPALELSAALRGQVEGREIDLALFFSPRTAETFVNLTRAAGLTESLKGIAAICLSEAVAEALRGLPWRTILMAARPNCAALLEAVEASFVDRQTEDRVAEPEMKTDTHSKAGRGAAGPRRKIGRLAPVMWFAGLVVLTAVAVYASWTLFSPNLLPAIAEALRPHFAPPPLSELGAPTIAQQITTLEDRIGKAEQQIAEPRKLVRALAERMAAGDAGLEISQRGLAGRIEAKDQRITARLTGLDERIAELEGVLALRRNDQTGKGPNGTALGRAQARLRETLAALDQRIATVEAMAREMAANASDRKAMAGLKEEGARTRASAQEFARRIAALETLARGGKALAREDQALVLALAQLRDALRGAQPFSAELDALKAAAGKDAGLSGPIAILSAHAPKGIPTIAVLRARFDVTAAAIVRQGLAPEGSGWMGETVARLVSLVSVRRTGADVPGDRPAALVARAEATLAGGELAQAVATLEKLTGAPAAAAAPWLGGARSRLEANSALAALGMHTVGFFARAEAASQPPGGTGRQ